MLTGLVICGRCGARMMTHHSGKSIQPRYACCSARINYGDPECQSLAARTVDEEVVRLALLALAPSSLEVSLQVAADWQQERQQADAQWQYRLQRAQFEADRARRQYNAVEPENRLVCRTLELEWEQKLRAQREIQEEYERFLRDEPKVLTSAEQDAIRQLAADVPAIWHSTTTTDVERKGILRQILDQVVIQIEGQSEWIEARLHWAGGHQTYTRFRRPVAKLTQLSEWPELQQHILTLKAAGRTAQEIAEQLNREGRTSPHLKPFTASTIRTALSRRGLTNVRRGTSEEPVTLAEGERFASDLARELGVRPQLVYAWIKSGRLPGRQAGSPQGRWIVRADADTVANFKTLTEPAEPISPKTSSAHRRNRERVTRGVV